MDEEKLEVLINHIDFVVVLFYKENDPASKNAAIDVDSIDDNLKERGISIVKTKNKDQIEMSVFTMLTMLMLTIHVLRYDIDVLPKLIYFESEIPTYWPDEVPLLGRSNNADFRFFNQFSFVFRQRDNPFVDWSLPRLGCYRGHNRGHA